MTALYNTNISQVRCAEAAVELVPVPLPCKSQQLRVEGICDPPKVLLAQFPKACSSFSAQYNSHVGPFIFIYMAQPWAAPPPPPRGWSWFPAPPPVGVGGVVVDGWECWLMES